MGRENDLEFGSPESNERFNTFAGLFERLTSRRLLLGAGLGAAASALVLRPETLIEPVEAAPQDVRGSGNIAVKSFSNKNGVFFLYSDGSIVDSAGNRKTEDRNNRWPLATHIRRPRAVARQPAGSPWVAVDVVQDKEGTHVLYADGSVRTPDDRDLSERALGRLEAYTIFYAVDRPGQPPTFYHPGLTRNGSRFSFEVPYIETPKFFSASLTNVNDIYIFSTGHPDGSYDMTVSTTEAVLTMRRPGRNFITLIIGESEEF